MLNLVVFAHIYSYLTKTFSSKCFVFFLKFPFAILLNLASCFHSSLLSFSLFGDLSLMLFFISVCLSFSPSSLIPIYGFGDQHQIKTAVYSSPTVVPPSITHTHGRAKLLILPHLTLRTCLVFQLS